MTTDKINYGHRLKAFSLRMEKETRQQLEEQAKLNDRTLTGEINHRLSISLEEKPAVSEHEEITSTLEVLNAKLDHLIELG